MPPTPERIQWAIVRLPLTLDGPLLEVGCAAGHALPLLLDRFPAARLTAIDRSTLQIARARNRLGMALESGRLDLHALSLEAAPAVLGADRYALMLAINVNAFWVTPSASLRSAAALLRPGGRLTLVYEPPGRPQLHALATQLPTLLEQHGFRVAEVTQVRFRASSGLCVAATRT